MEIIKSIKDMQIRIRQLAAKQIGFVPTMGFFHEGHISLMETARKENDVVVTSIFVNPLQFGPAEDYEAYPRDEERDCQIAEAHGVDILFLPDVKDMYPGDLSISMKVTQRTNVLCGKSRAGHFDGVVTVLSKLFNIVQPNKTYFGMKDAQQLAVVDSLISDLNFPIKLVGLPTVREKDGLAKSSRNVYLSKNERKEASWLYQSLLHGQTLISKGERDPIAVVSEVSQLIQKETNGQIDYIEILSYPKLEPISVINQRIILAMAVKFNHTRLIDNVILTPSGGAINQY